MAASVGIAFLLSFSGVAVFAQSAGPGSQYMPPYSIYGTPSVPSSVSVLNSTAEYWGPYINTLYYTWFTTSEALVEALVNGYIQFDSNGITTVQQYNQIQPYTATGQLALNISAGNTFGYIAFNTNKGLTANVWVRRALQQLTNYAEESQALDNGILGIASPYYLYPGIYGTYFTTAEAQAYATFGTFSVAGAEADLAKACFPTGSTNCLVDNSGHWDFTNGTQVPALQLYTSSGAGLELELDSIDAMTNNANAIGFTVNVNPVDFNTIIDSILPSGSFSMYFLGWSLGTPVSPDWLYPIFGNYPLNTGYQDFVNQTMWNLFYTLYTASATQALALQYTQESAVDLQSQLPYVVLSWGSEATPVNVQTWKGYTLEAPYGLLLFGEIHPAGAIFGSLYRFGTPQNPDTLNPYVATSLYDFQILDQEFSTPLSVSVTNPVGIVANEAYNYSLSTLTGTDPNGHYVNGTVVTMNFNPDVYWSDGVPLTAADYNFTIWYLNFGGFTSNPYHPSSDTLTIDPGVSVNYTAESSNPALEYFGEGAGLVDSYVPPSNPYQIEIFFNTTSIFNLLSVYGEITLPEHIFGSVSPTALASETTSQYLAQEVFSGPYTLYEYSPSNSYAQLQYNPSYFLANPLSYQMNATAGSTATFTMTADLWNASALSSSSTGFAGTYSPVNGATGTLYVMNPSTLATIGTYTLTAGSNGQYTAQIPTGSLPAGTSYTLLAQLSWTGASYMDFANGGTTGNTYYYHQYSTLNVVSPSTTQSTSSSHSTTQATSSISTTGVSIATSSTAEYIVLGIVVIAIVVLVVALVARRGTRG
jgi:ABC-type transport system substrate-binding protein